MKKTSITSAVILSAFMFASAQGTASSSVPAMPAALPPMITTGSSTVDAQVKALHREMEAKIKAVRDEYQVKLKAIIGERKAMIASSTKEIRKEVKEERKEVRQEVKKDAQEVRKEIMKEKRIEKATSTRPFSSMFNVFRGYFGSAEAVEQQ